jgi:YVTN family beta-propeller protein
MKKYFYLIAALTILLPALSSCNDGNEVEQPSGVIVDTSSSIPYANDGTSIQGFYLLNEGQMGKNNASLDCFHYANGSYFSSRFKAANDSAKLGDVGNDIEVYGNKLYVVMNGSNMVRVLDARTAKKIADISIPNCRNVVFNSGKAYVTSFAGTIKYLDPSNRVGYIAKIDTATLSITDTCNVEYQPEQMAICNEKLYVANSGGYMPTPDNRVSVIDLATFTKEKDIPVGINLKGMLLSKENEIFVSSQGNYTTTETNLFAVNLTTEKIDTLNINVSMMDICGDSIYTYGSALSGTSSYHIINTKSHKVVSNQIITDGTSIVSPYLIKINPISKDIYISDSGSTYGSPGILYCFNSKGNLKWHVTTGVGPGHMVFTPFAIK